MFLAVSAVVVTFMVHRVQNHSVCFVLQIGPLVGYGIQLLSLMSEPAKTASLCMTQRKGCVLYVL